MVRSSFPVYIDPSHAVSERLGNRIAEAASIAIRAILKNRRGLEVACQLVLYRGIPLALSSRITEKGDFIVALDIGDPNLTDRLILEDELRIAERRAREKGKKVREGEGPRRTRSRRW